MKSKYILEQTLAKTLRHLHLSEHGSPHPVLNEDSIQGLSKDLLGLVERAVSGKFEIQVISFEELKSRLDSLLEKMFQKYPDATAVTTDRDLAFFRGIPCLELNRLIAPSLRPRWEWKSTGGSCSGEYGEIIGVGPRPGTHNLEKQMQSIKSRVGNGAVVILEDGAFTGSTLRLILNLFQQAKIEIVGIVLGFLFPAAAQQLADYNFKGEVLYWMGPEDLNDHAEWMPDHDFLPFMPGSGRVVGYTLNGRHRPVYNLNGFHLCKPYIYPFGDPTEWASIPSENAHIFSRDCLLLAENLFWEINRSIGADAPLVLKHLRSTRIPRVGIPVSVTSQEFPDLNQSIVGLIKEYRASVEFDLASKRRVVVS